MVFVVRLFSEITVKSAPVRKRWTKILAQNIRTLGRQLFERTSVVQDWDRIEVRVHANSAELRAEFLDLLGRVPGISTYAEVRAFPLVDMHDIYEKTAALWAKGIENKKFGVRVKRSGKHDFKSGDVERYVGGGLNQMVSSAQVNLSTPDVMVNIEIKNDNYYVLAGKHKGLGGFPIGTQDPVLSLVSGGFDSTVASYLMIKRGMRTHYCFFSLGGRAHELGVKEIAYFLWRKYGASHRVKFVTVPFEGVVSEILEKIGPSNMGVVLKRMMIRASEQIAKRVGIQAIVTGEAISQVSSQTITNLNAIDKVSNMLVLRPLVAAAKPDIIDLSRDIGVEEFSANIPEYCGVISVKPSAAVKLDQVEAEEENFNFDVLTQAVEQCRRQSIDEVMKDCQDVTDINVVSELPETSIVIDIRHPDEIELKPLPITERESIAIPFYSLNSKVETLEKAQKYFLYCDRGVMSELHASHLIEAGHSNVGVFRPAKKISKN
ncbi:MAG: tRNA 4-thiouridine(8) synthase ThiI [Agarilytica sp.]